MMKKPLALLLSLAMLLSLTACGGSTPFAPAASDTNDAQTEGNDPVQTQLVDAAHLSYEDPAEMENFRLDEGDIQLQIDHPFGFRFDGHGNGTGSESSSGTMPS